MRSHNDLSKANKTMTAAPADSSAKNLQAILDTSGAALAEGTRKALSQATASLVGLQNKTGFWCGELEGDSILQSEYILLKFIIEQENDPRLPKIAAYLRYQQRDSDGAWVQYPGGSPDLSATVKAYFALKLMGGWSGTLQYLFQILPGGIGPDALRLDPRHTSGSRSVAQMVLFSSR
jgi:hypothetical protein